MTKKIIIPYFPKGLRYATPFILAITVYLIIIDFWFWGIVLFVVCMLVLNTHYVTEINLHEKKYFDFISLVGLRLSMESTSFNRIDRIVITKGSYAQTVNTRVQSRTMKWTDYTGTLLFDQNKTLDLVTRNSKKELVHGLRDFAKFLGVGIEDRSTKESYWIDVDK